VANDPGRIKASVRDLGAALVSGVSAGLTVSATLFAAKLFGIHVFATGGIGGVHQGVSETGDISTDLLQLSRTPVITVCAGAKSILDLPRTLEHLETFGVPVFGLRTATFPAFYLASSGLPIPRLDSEKEIAAAAQASWDIGYDTGVVVGNPVPQEHAIKPEEWSGWYEQALLDANEARVRGKDVTPFLLARVGDLSIGKTVQSNVALLINNAGAAARIAVALGR
jgi:pseudouridine-5'-phosphate glycosidase